MPSESFEHARSVLTKNSLSRTLWPLLARMQGTFASLPGGARMVNQMVDVEITRVWKTQMLRKTL